MRLFIAINLPAELRRTLWEATAPLRTPDVPIRWVAPEAIHLTLKFLGDVAPPLSDPVAEGVSRAVGTARRFTLPIGGFGAFPSVRRPRVVWVGCEAVPPLELLQHRVEQEMAALGFEVEGRPFRPHLTLGRVRGDARGAPFRDFERTLEPLTYDAEAPVEAVELMESRLSRAGATYTVRHRAELRA